MPGRVRPLSIPAYISRDCHCHRPAPPVALLQECLMQTHKQTKLIEQTIPEKLGGRKPRPALAPLKLGLKVATHTFYL